MFGEPGQAIGAVEHHVPARREKPEFGEDLDLLANVAQRGHVECRDEHHVGGFLDGGQGLLLQAGRGVDDHVPERA